GGDVTGGGAEHIRADRVVAHVEVLTAVEIPDEHAGCSRKVTRPLFRQKHFRALRQQLRPAGNAAARTRVQLRAAVDGNHRFSSPSTIRSRCSDNSYPSLLGMPAFTDRSPSSRASRVATSVMEH